MQCPNCRAAVPAASRYCNACGASVVPARPQASPPPVQTYQPQNPYPTQHPYGQVPGMETTQQYPPGYMPGTEAPLPRKKPIALLAAVIAALVVGIAGVSAALWQRSRNPVVASNPSVLPSGPGVPQAGGTENPPHPGVVAVPGTGTPAPGPPVTGAPGTPKQDDGLAPPVTGAGGGGPPRGPMVTSSKNNPDAPGYPVVGGQGTPRPNAPPVTGGQGSTPPVRQPVTGGGAPPAPRDNSDFDRYLRWLQFVENERNNLRAQGETESFHVIDSFYQAMLGLADPDTNDAQLQAQMDQNLRNSLQRTVAAINNFGRNITRSKPAVPSDCRALDSYYMAAVRLEAEQTAVLLDALARKDIGRIRAVGSRTVASIDTNLGAANRQLEEVYRQRGLNPQFRIQTGGNSSMLGGLVGLGGMR
jgi:hypothetical protein